MFDLNTYLQEQVQEMDINQIVHQEIRELIRGQFDQHWKQIVRNHIETLINEQIISMLAQPIQVDNGWGTKKEYPTFEDLFKQEFYKRLNESWQIKRIIEKTIKMKVAELFDRNLKVISDKIVAEVIIPLKKN